jgi:2-desacetyl-2-hydroxyethyl bacteriochlorophyllide A dehydrogenase
MKSLTAFGANRIEIVESDPATLDPGEILVAPILTGVCGTDLEIVHSKIDPDFVIYPVVLGHEWCGRVVDVGSTDTSIKVGDRVVVEGIITCQQCFECTSGNSNRCTIYDEIGFTRPGAAADLIKVPARLAHTLTENVSNESGALVEPTAVVTQGILKTNPKKGARVLIIGDGTIALIAGRLIRNWAPSAVHMLGLKSGQVALSEKAGIDAFFTEFPMEKYDVIIEASGSSERISQSIRGLVRGGKLLLLGFTGADIATPISIDDVVNGDLSILASFGYSRSAWKETVSLLNSGALDLTFLVTHRFALSDFEAAVSALATAPAPRGKIVFELGK